MAGRLVLVLGDLYIPDRAPDIPAKDIATSCKEAEPAFKSWEYRDQEFKKLLTPGKISQILFLGNLTSPAAYNYLRSIAPDVHLVRGELDIEGLYPSPPSQSGPGAPPTPASASSIPANIPVSKVVQHGSLRIGFTHGHTIVPNGDPDALLIAARHMDVDVLCWGGTNRFEAYEMEGKFFVNPGSATGAESWGWQDGSGEVKEGEKKEDTESTEGVPSFCLMDVQGDVLVLYVYQLKTDESGGETVSVEKVSFRKDAEEAAPTQ